LYRKAFEETKINNLYESAFLSTWQKALHKV